MKNFLWLLLILFGFIFASPTHAVITFERWYGGDGCEQGYSVDQTSDDGYIIAGNTSSFVAGKYDVYLIKTDSLGDTIWTRTYGGTNSDVGRSIAITSDLGYVIGGYTNSFGAGDYDVYLIKTDSLGDTVWTRTYGGLGVDKCYSVAQTSDGGYILAGFTTSFSIPIADVYLIKTDSLGDTIWTRTYGGTNSDVGRSIAITSDLGYVIGGSTSSFGVPNNTDVYLIKTDPMGDTIWTKTYHGEEVNHGYSLALTHDGGYIIAGSTGDGEWTNNLYFIKTDSVGDSIWAGRTYCFYDFYAGYSIATTSNGGYIIAGTNGWDESSALNLWKIDSLGEIMWFKQFGGLYFDVGRSVVPTTDGGYIVTGKVGFETTSSYHWDVYLIKTDEDGNAIEEEKQRPETTNMELYSHPNPFTSTTTIILSPSSSDLRGSSYELNIYDVSGRLLKSVPLTTNHLTLGADLSPGVYFLKLKTDESSITRKLIKVK